ncbi:MAG: hypothetical protein ACREFW_03225 [Rhizomicrobium sp.]
MTEDRGTNYFRLALGAGLLAATAVGLAIFVPRRRWAQMAEPLRALLDTSVATAVTTWAAGLWHEATQPGPPAFNDLRPFDEF